MQISQKSKEIIDNCRFCWMCRHICPIGNATGQERNNARARALALSLVERGAEPLSGVADNVYECALCGACTKECVTGFDPVKFTKEVRLELALHGETPDKIGCLLDKIEQSGNIYGEMYLPDVLKREISTLPEQAETLLFLGTDARYRDPEGAIAAIRLLKAAGVSFTVLTDEPDSGYALDFLVGAAEETHVAAEKCAERLQAFRTVVAYDPGDAKMFLREYKEWGVPLAPMAVNFPAYLAGLIKSGKLTLKPGNEIYTFQDPGLLSRDLEEETAAREVLAACGGIQEMLLYGKDTMLAGNLIMNEYMPDVMRTVAQMRWQNAANMDVSVLVTASPAEYVMLSEQRPGGMQLKRLEEVVLSCL